MVRFKPSALLLLLAILIIPLSCEQYRGESETDRSRSGQPRADTTDARQEKGVQEVNSQQDTSGVRISPGHIVMMTPDLEQTQQFYEEHLELHTTEEVVYDGLHRIFMSASDKHHELVLLESRVEEFPPIEERQLQQVAFEVPTHERLVEYYKHIRQTDIPHVIMDNQVSLSLYFPDPNDVTVEIYWDITDQPFGEQMWRGNQFEISEEKFLNPFEQMER